VVHSGHLPKCSLHSFPKSSLHSFPKISTFGGKRVKWVSGERVEWTFGERVECLSGERAECTTVVYWFAARGCNLLDIMLSSLIRLLLFHLWVSVRGQTVFRCTALITQHPSFRLGDRLPVACRCFGSQPAGLQQRQSLQNAAARQ